MTKFEELQDIIARKKNNPSVTDVGSWIIRSIAQIGQHKT